MFEKSFYLLRTNAALTTNVKVVVTKQQKLFLESYQATRSLGGVRFQHFAIDKESYLFEEIPHFFTGISSETAFKVRSEDDQSVMYDDFANQFDDIYLAGSAWTQDTFYDEEFEYTAPLWIKPDSIPKGFVVFRVDGPGLDDGNSPTNFRAEILDNWKIVEYFDLTEKADLGFFIRHQTEHQLFPSSPLNVNFENLRLSTFNGINFNTTGYVSKSVNLEFNYQKNTPIFRTEEYFTNQWRDLGVIFPNIFNFKFLFDDTPATPDALRRWSLNRYIGFYLDEIDKVEEISPYQPFALNKIPEEKLQQLTIEKVSEIPYVLDNTFVQDVGLRRFSYDPIFGGWIDAKIYYAEWQGKFFQLKKVENDRFDIIGQYLYQIISTVNIEYPVPDEITNPQLQEQYRKVLINEISTLKNQIVVVDKLTFENVEGNNIIQHTDTTFTTLGRNYERYLYLGHLKWGFTITLQATLDNNLFSIPNFDDADLYWIEINSKKYVIKQYAASIPSIGGLYYILSDEAIRINNISEQIWINDGINNKDSIYYQTTDVQNVPVDGAPIYYSIFRASFNDVKDFDFDRVTTDYTNYEYQKENTITESIEPKLYAKDRRTIKVAVEKPIEINDKNFSNEQLRDFLLSDPTTYTEWLSQYDTGHEIVKNGSQIFFNVYTTYVDFKWNNIVNEEIFSIGSTVYNDDNDPSSIELSIKTYQALLPLYINPTRVPIVDSNDQQFTDPITGELLWQKDWKGDYVFTINSAPSTQLIDLNREWYREEGYILLQQDEPNQETQSLDFLSQTEPLEIKIKYPWDDPSNSDSRTITYPMAYEFKWTPYQKSVSEPNEEVDTNYVPISSEYITSEELWETRENALTTIWNKNQYVCKWGFLNSIGHADYPYRLNYDLEVGNVYNQSPNPFSDIPYAVRQFRDLDYFYRFGITSLPSTYAYYSLHLKEQFFDVDKYLTANYDYFDWLFKSDTLTTKNLMLTKKYSMFSLGDIDQASQTLFKGIKYGLFDVTDRVFNEEFLDENLEVVEDYIRAANPEYNDYKFSIVMGKKLSTFGFNSGDNDGDFGIDIYLNDKWKNCLIHLYFETDQTITITTVDEDGNETIHNLETTEIDNLYDSDTIVSQETDEVFWEHGKLKINGNQQIADLRVRDLKLYNFLAILNEPNYDPVNGEGRRPVHFIHVYENGNITFMDSTDTDFVIEFTLPEQFLIKEKTFTVEMAHETALVVNDTIRNRIIIDDDPNNPLGDPNYTSQGALVNSITNLNSWDGYPFARIINDGNNNDQRQLYDLDKKRDPVIYRHNGPYIPIFKDLALFRPTGYWALTESSEEIEPSLNSNNWKFYDDYSDGQETGPVLTNFGYLNEFMFSKINLGGNILKLAALNQSDKRSIYPIVDEYGYDFTQRYSFQSTWDRNFYIEARKMELPANEYPGKAGYTVYFDGFDAKLTVDDAKKFNVVADEFVYDYATPPVIPPLDPQTLDLMNLVPDAAVGNTNWTLGRSGVGELEHDSGDNSLKFINEGESYWEFNSNIKVEPGQIITMSVMVKTDLADSRMKFYCGIRQYGADYNGQTKSENDPGSVGSNSGHVYFVSSAYEPLSTYTLKTGTYTVPSNGTVVYIRPLILFNHLYGSQYPPIATNTMWAKDFTFVVSPTVIETQLELYSIDFSKETSFVLKKTSNGAEESYTLPYQFDSNIFNYIFSDNIGFVNAFNKNDDSMAILSSSSLEYRFLLDETDETNLNGHRYILRSGTGIQTQILSSATINSDISNGDIMFEMQTNTRGNIEFNVIIEGAKAFNLDDFVTSANRFLAPDYELSNTKLTNVNLNYTISAAVANEGPAYNFNIIEIRNAIEDKSQHINSPQETTLTQYSNVGELTYVGQNGTLYENKAITSFTVEFWINIDGFKKQNETLLYKGNQDIPEDDEIENQVFSWIVRRYNNTAQLEFVTRSYVTTDSTNLVNIDPETNAVHEDRLVTTTSIEDQLWHQVACVFDAEKRQKRIYLDGLINTTTEHTNFTNIIVEPFDDVDSNDWPLYIASDYRNGSINFTGSMDELRVWNYARTDSEILKNSNLRVTPSAYLNPFKSLIGYWVFDEQLGTPIVDNSISVDEVERIQIVSNITTNDGNQEISTTTTKYIQNEQSLFDTVNINQEDTGIDWNVSGAEILGVSDERYSTPLPPTTTRRKLKNIPNEIVPRSKFVVEFELPPPQALPPPKPVPAIPPPPPVKVVELPTKKRRRPIFIKPLRLKRKFVLRPLPTISASLSLNKIDKFSKKRKRLEQYQNADEKFRLDDRIANIRKIPFQILNKRTRILRKPQTTKVDIGKNRRGLVNAINSYYFKPKRDLSRRSL